MSQAGYTAVRTCRCRAEPRPRSVAVHRRSLARRAARTRAGRHRSARSGGVYTGIGRRNRSRRRPARRKSCRSGFQVARGNTAGTGLGAPRLQSGHMTTRIAVLASGGGSNLQALFDYHSRLAERRNGTLVLVASDRAAAKALDRARVAGVATEVIGNPDDGESICEMLEAHRAELIVLAGYLRLVPTAVVDRWSNRIVNVHPALLPSFGGKGMYGMRVHRAVLESGARISGPTVHIVDAEYDRGRILSQWPVPVLGNDTPESLAARVLRAEHMLLPRVVEL